MQSWFILYTKPRTEKKIKEELDSLKIQNFLPLLKQKRKWSDRTKIIEIPMFASYIFVFIDYVQDSLKILSRPNSLQFIHFENKPATISEEEINMIELFLKEYPEKLQIQELNKIKIGNEIEIKDGPFAGKTGIIEKIKNKFFLILKIKSLQKEISVEVNLKELGIDFP
jgi:transcriptional antiterminator RfaH